MPADLAIPPQRAYQLDPPQRDKRWVVIVSGAADCNDPDVANLLVVLLSTRIDLGGPCDVTVLPPDGGVTQTCLAETDIVLTVDKREMSGQAGARYRGTLMADTFTQIRALLRTRLALS